MIKKLFLLLFLLVTTQIFSQSYNLSGVVSDSSGVPLIGANVILQQTSYGAATDSQGRFSITSLKPGKYSIEVSMIGYASKFLSNLNITNKSISLNIILSKKIIESEQVVVTAGKYEQKISELPVSANIISSEELAKKDITDLSDMMRFVPGVNMVDDQISIRGSSGYSRGAGTRVLLEIDGIPYFTGDTGEIIWEILPVSEIQKVEVIKGAASSLYGSSAIGGVVNIITQPIKHKPQTYIKTGIGVYDNPSYDEWDWSKEFRPFTQLTLAHSQRFGKFGLSASLTRLSNTGYKQSGFYTRYIGYVKGIYNFSPVSSITFFANTLNQHSGNFLYWKNLKNALVPPDADQGQSVNANRYMFGGIYKNVLGNDILLNIKASYYRTSWNDQTSSFDTSKTNLFRGEVQINKSFGNDLVLITGAEFTTSRVNSNLFGSPNSLGLGAYAHVDYSFSPVLRMSLGIRYDFNRLNNSNSSNAISPKIGMNYHFSDKLILRTSFGTGFRAPTLAEAFTSTTAGGLTIKPNPNLKPETNWTFEVGANYKAFKNLDFDLAVFQNEFKNFIEAGVDPVDGLAHFSNLTRARIQGLEFNSNINLLNDKIKLSLNYTYLWARDLVLNQDLKYRPRNLAVASIDYYLKQLNIGADFRYHSRVEQMDFELVDLGLVKDGRARVAVYVLDLRAAYNFAKDGIPMRIHLNVNNVLNYNYVELIGNLAPIRNYSLSAEFLF